MPGQLVGQVSSTQEVKHIAGVKVRCRTTKHTTVPSDPQSIVGMIMSGTLPKIILADKSRLHGSEEDTDETQASHLRTDANSGDKHKYAGDKEIAKWQRRKGMSKEQEVQRINPPTGKGTRCLSIPQINGVATEVDNNSMSDQNTKPAIPLLIMSMTAEVTIFATWHSSSHSY